MNPLLDYTVIDIETTGLNPREDGITELAAIRVRNGEIVDRFQELVNPGVPIPHFLEVKTHITNEMVSCACPTCEVLTRFLDFIGQDILMGYNIDRFDKQFIGEKFLRELHIQFCPRTYDVFPIARRTFRGLVQSFKLDSLREVLGIEDAGAHRALKDCFDTYQVYLRILKMPPQTEPECAFSVSFCSRSDVSPDELVKMEAHEEMFRAKEREILGWFPTGFHPVDKPYIPTCHKERWIFVRNHPFETLAGANVVITGSSDRMPRLIAERVVGMAGATLKQSATRDCDFLVDLGNGGCGKYENARKWIQKGSPLRIITEEEFVRLVRASITEIPPTDAYVEILKGEIVVMRNQSEANVRELKDRIRANLKKRVTVEELHNWRQEFSQLWNRILEDDIIEPKELEEIREWLYNHMRKMTDYKSMFALMDCVIADGIVDYEESMELFAEAEKCLITMGRDNKLQNGFTAEGVEG